MNMKNKIGTLALSLLVGGAAMTSAQAYAAWSKGRYGATNMSFTLGNKQFSCGQFAANPSQQNAHVAINETQSIGWWGSCSSGNTTVGIDVNFSVKGGPTPIAAGTGPSTVSVTRVVKLNVNGTVCNTNTSTYSRNLSNSSSSSINQATTVVTVTGCNGATGTARFNEMIGGMDS